jgi:hypothetical protein
MKQDFDFARDVAAAFGGIPAEHVDMGRYGCDSIHCVAGHMARHPALNLGAEGDGVLWRLRAAYRISGERYYCSEKCSVDDLFNSGPAGIRGKKEFARRVIAYLRDHGQSVSQAYLDEWGIT